MEQSPLVVHTEEPTQMSWLIFRDSGQSKSGKTKIWDVCSRTNQILGLIFWYAPWRKYVFGPENGTVFDEKCLIDIAGFCQEKTREHKRR